MIVRVSNPKVNLLITINICGPIGDRFYSMSCKRSIDFQGTTRKTQLGVGGMILGDTKESYI